MARKPCFAGRHDGIVILRERGPQDRQQRAHPGAIEIDAPGVLDRRRAAALVEQPRAGSAEIALGVRDETRRRLDVDDGRQEPDRMGNRLNQSKR
jgi:hypothetical protein